VYDLGGGTFDAAVLRRTGFGWEILGLPEGVERLGGIDFDAAVLRHVVKAVGEAYDALDGNDPPVLAAVSRLRQECTAAKEALTADTDATIPVLLPGLHTEVRLTRGEFEDMIRPSLTDSIAALERALRSAAIPPHDVSSVLLVGGSSRIPLVAQMVSSSLGRPVAVDDHPKHSVAMGAAMVAAEQGLERVPTGAPALLMSATPAVASDNGTGTGTGVGAGLATLAPDHTDPLYPYAPATPATPAVPATFRSGEVGLAAYEAPVPDRIPPGRGADDEDEPQRPTVALLICGAAALVLLVMGGLMMITGDDHDGGGQSEKPAARSPLPGSPETQAIEGSKNPVTTVTTVPGTPATLAPGTPITAPRAKTPTPTAPPPTTEAPPPPTTEPPTTAPPTTEPPPPPTTEPPTTTPPTTAPPGP
jgi:hypothetical protein